MSRILITGDTHGTYDVGKLEQFFFAQENDYTKDDYLIICGDVGVCGFTSVGSQATREFLQNLPVTVLFVDGNHENHVSLKEYEVEEWKGGKVHFIADDIIHLMRGQVYEINGETFFTFGGAYSIDRSDRIKGISWFPEEIPTEEEYREGWENLKKHNYKVDHVITHTAPIDVVAELGFSSEDEAERQCEEFQSFADEIEFRHWWFGHFHLDEDIEDQFHCLMDRVIDLGELENM